MMPPVLSLSLRQERDVVLARQRTRQLAAMLGFDVQDQTRLATAVSEIARNAFAYARDGKLVFRIEGATVPQLLVIEVSDAGPGIADLETILAGRYRSPTGMGVGIIGAQRLMDRFDIASGPGRGTTVILKKFLARASGPIGARELGHLATELAQEPALDPFGEMQRQNQELLHALDELGKRQRELATLNRELEDTNRGVVALYSELDEKAEHLRRADELKSRFLSNMSHEFRTPVNSIQALTRLLLDRVDGELTVEQERQVGFIRKAADALAELVSDLLDLAKVEAGKIVVHPVEFDVGHLFGTLRGMLKPLLVNESVSLIFDEPADVPLLYTDEAKISQILRNFISNALKFTERGEVRVSACAMRDERTIRFSVADTGIGIAAEDQERVFNEFTQIDNPIQRRVHGTGLGLPLCRKLAELLGGRVEVASTLGVGSTFTAVIPMFYHSRLPTLPEWHPDERRIPILVIDDDAELVLVYEKMLSGTAFQLLAARNLREARAALGAFRPRAIVLDILLDDAAAWSFLAELKQAAETRDIPVAVISTVEDEGKGSALGADAYCVKPIDRAQLLQVLTRIVDPDSIRRILIADDEEIFRYVLRQHLAAPAHVVTEAASGSDALRLAHETAPDVICLDLGMPDLDGFEVLRQLRDDPVTRAIPVVIITSRPLAERERRRLLEQATAVLSKERASREDTLAAVTQAMRDGAPQPSAPNVQRQ